MDYKSKYRKSRKAKRRPVKDGAKCGNPKCGVCSYYKVHGYKSYQYNRQAGEKKAPY